MSSNICKDCGRLKEPVCICGKSIKEGEKVYIIRNIKNGNKLGVGSCCIGIFERG